MQEAVDPKARVATFLDRFGKERNVTLPPLSPEGVGSIQRGSAVVTIHVLTEKNVLLLLARVAAASVVDEALARRLLTASFVETGDAAFALHPQTGDLYLRLLRGLEGLDYDEFEDLVESIAKTADHWDDKLGVTGRLGDAAATVAVGARLAALVRGGDAIALIGDLGAGKTTLVTGLVAALGGGTAASPTFSLVNEYPGGRLVVWHVDLYRIERAAELPELGLDDVIGDPRGICVVEWAERFAVLPADHLRIELGHAPDGSRDIAATGTGPRGRELAAELLGWGLP